MVVMMPPLMSAFSNGENSSAFGFKVELVTCDGCAFVLRLMSSDRTHMMASEPSSS